MKTLRALEEALKRCHYDTPPEVTDAASLLLLELKQASLGEPIITVFDRAIVPRWFDIQSGIRWANLEGKRVHLFAVEVSE